MKSEEVARLAGVSRSTVSRVINNYSNVPDDTRERVMRVIREHDYVPNNSARILAGKSADTIGLFLFNLHDERPGRIFGNGYLGPYITATVDRSNAAGYSVLTHTVTKMEDCAKISRAFQEKRIEGAILIGIERAREVEELFRGSSWPMAVTDFNTDALSEIASARARLMIVNSDDDSGIGSCIAHLAELGHKRIAFIKGNMFTWSGECRLNAFYRHMAKAGLPIRDEWVLEGNFHRRLATESVRKLLMGGELPTAILASNDTMARATVETLHSFGLRVPQDMSVIGYDDHLVAQLAHPALTTVRVPAFEMASRAVDGVIALLDEDVRIIRTATLSIDLIVRDSCGHPPAEDSRHVGRRSR